MSLTDTETTMKTSVQTFDCEGIELICDKLAEHGIKLIDRIIAETGIHEQWIRPISDAIQSLEAFSASILTEELTEPEWEYVVNQALTAWEAEIQTKSPDPETTFTAAQKTKFLTYIKERNPGAVRYSGATFDEYRNRALAI